MHKPSSDLKPVTRRIGASVFLVLMVVCTPVLTRAIPLHEYRTNIQRTIGSLAKLVETEEYEGAEKYQQRLNEATETARTTLPEKQSVEQGKETVTVDNTWLNKDLADLEKATAADRSAKLARIIDRLKALEERVGELESPGAAGPDNANASQRLAAILARPEYSVASGRNAIVRLLDQFVRWIQRLVQKYLPNFHFPSFNPSGAGIIVTVVKAVVFALATALILYVGFILIRKFRRPEKRKTSAKKEPRIVLGEQLAPEESATDLLAEAEALALRGDVRAAIRKAYIALLVELGDRKLLTLAQHKTNRDYLLSLKNLPALHATVNGLTSSFELHWYGFAQATATDWQEFRSGYQTALHAKS